jgi:hypothetical protein
MSNCDFIIVTKKTQNSFNPIKGLDRITLLFILFICFSRKLNHKKRGSELNFPFLYFLKFIILKAQL